MRPCCGRVRVLEPGLAVRGAAFRDFDAPASFLSEDVNGRFGSLAAFTFGVVFALALTLAGLTSRTARTTLTALMDFSDLAGFRAFADFAAFADCADFEAMAFLLDLAAFEACLGLLFFWMRGRANLRDPVPDVAVFFLEDTFDETTDFKRAERDVEVDVRREGERLESDSLIRQFPLSSLKDAYP